MIYPPPNSNLTFTANFLRREMLKDLELPQTSSIDTNSEATNPNLDEFEHEIEFYFYYLQVPTLSRKKLIMWPPKSRTSLTQAYDLTSLTSYY